MNVLSFLGTGKYWLIAIAVVGALSFGAGYVRATKSAESILADKVQEAYDSAVQAQRKYDDAERKVAVADALKRQAANQKTKEAAATVVAAAPVLVPENPVCTISADAIKQLNEIIK